MVDISVKDLVKSFEVGSVLLDGLSFDIHEGDYLALLDGKLLGTDRDVSALLDGLSDEAASREAEFITVFYGEDVNEEDARKACDAFTRKCPDAEVNLICGGQPVYYYIISIE